MELAEKYINPFADFGFKRLFGEEPNKDLLLDFLNELVKDAQGDIKSINYLKMPKFKKSIDELNSRFDKWIYIIKNLNKPVLI